MQKKKYLLTVPARSFDNNDTYESYTVFTFRDSKRLKQNEKKLFEMNDKHEYTLKKKNNN